MCPLNLADCVYMYSKCVNCGNDTAVFASSTCTAWAAYMLHCTHVVHVPLACSHVTLHKQYIYRFSRPLSHTSSTYTACANCFFVHTSSTCTATLIRCITTIELLRVYIYIGNLCPMIYLEVLKTLIGDTFENRICTNFKRF